MNFKEAIQRYQPANQQEVNDKNNILEYINIFNEEVLTRKNKIAHITSSGLILNKSLDKMLMIHHNIYNTWTWTGGHADGDSDMLYVALKEAKEETGVLNIIPQSDKIASIDILPVYGHIKRDEYVSSHLHLNISYVLIADEEEKMIVNEEETTGVAWIDVNRLVEYSNEQYIIDIYRKIIDKARTECL
ncbi:NUDIX hydrolase [Clostridium sp. DL1XJH146]